MPTIVFASPKGGVGKTTSCLLLAQRLAEMDYDVVVVDADSRYRCMKWILDAEGNRHSGIPANLKVEAADADSVQEKIEAAAALADYVLVDLQGTADLTMYGAIQMADFVVIPTQASDMDVEEATATIKLISRHQKAIQRAGNPDYRLPYGVLFTRTSAAVRSRTLRHIENSLIEARIPIFHSEINERDAYKAFYSYRTVLSQLTDKEAPNVEKAIENADKFKQELFDVMAGRVELVPPAPTDEGAQA